MPEELSALVSKLREKDGLVRQTARLTIQDIGVAAVPLLCNLMKDKRKYARWEAAKALAEIHDPSSAPVLVKALEDKIFDVRWLAAVGLIRIGTPSLIPTLRAILVSTDNDWLWDGVRHVVRGLAKGDMAVMLVPLVAAFDSIDFRINVPIEARNLLIELRALPEDEK